MFFRSALILIFIFNFTRLKNPYFILSSSIIFVLNMNDIKKD